MTQPVARGARAIARAQITGEILQLARASLGEVGAGSLSLRAIARDMGMASSAIYRYFPSRDDLLTALLIEVYNDLGEAAERADEAFADRADLVGRWVAICHAVRDWARAHPHDYALLYGTPVPGYAAPADTVHPATRVTALISALVPLARARGLEPAPTLEAGEAFGRSVAGVREFLGGEVNDAVVLRSVMAWTTLYGTVSFELFGQLKGAVDDVDAYFDLMVRQLAHDIGLAGSTA